MSGFRACQFCSFLTTQVIVNQIAPSQPNPGRLRRFCPLNARPPQNILTDSSKILAQAFELLHILIGFKSQVSGTELARI